jgi:hypothetical protein
MLNTLNNLKSTFFLMMLLEYDIINACMFIHIRVLKVY